MFSLTKGRDFPLVRRLELFEGASLLRGQRSLFFRGKRRRRVRRRIRGRGSGFFRVDSDG